MHVIHANSALSLLFICFERVWVVQHGAWCITRPSGSWSYMDSLFKKRSEKILTASASTLESTNLALALQCDFWLSKLLQQGLLVKGTHFFLSSFAHPCLISNPYDFLSSVEHERRHFVAFFSTVQWPRLFKLQKIFIISQKSSWWKLFPFPIIWSFY